MNILKDTSLECNPYLKINFDGGDLSSDAGLLLIKEFAEKIGVIKLIYALFKTNDTAMFRYHMQGWFWFFCCEQQIKNRKRKSPSASRIGI